MLIDSLQIKSRDCQAVTIAMQSKTFWSNLLDALLMALLTVGALLAQSQPPSPTPTKDSQIKQGDGDHKEQGQKSVQPSVSVSTNNSRGAEENDKKPAHSDGWIDSFSAILAVTAVLQYFIYRKQTKVMSDALKETAKAADAALAQVNLTIAKERARLSIFTAHSPDLRQFITPADVFARIEIGNDGATKAFEVEASVECFIGEGRDVTVPTRPFPYWVGVIRAEQSDAINAEHVLTCSSEDLKSIENGTLTFWMHTVVTYVDIFSSVRPV
jgi:hypothetical protein